MKKYWIKKMHLFVWLTLLSSITLLNAETIPNVKIKDLSGKTLNSSDFDNNKKPIIISFWATWCKPCLEELNTINDLYEEWQKNTGVKLVAVSIDDSRSSKKVPPLVKSKGWEYEVYLDVNSDLKRAMGVVNPPHTFLLDANKNIVYQHNGFAPGDEEKLYEEIKKIVEVKE